MNRRGFLSRAALGAAAAPLAVHSLSIAQTAGKYRACIIGDTKQGGYGHSLHLLWKLRDDVEVVALADPDEAGRLRHAGEAGAARTYADYREMLEKEKPDLVAVGPRWTIHHKEYLLACAAVNAHGIIEKPLTPDLAEADEALAAIRAANLKWAIAFNVRASLEIAHAKRLLFEEGLIGEILEVHSRGKEDRRSGGEDLIVLGIHLFDLIRYFLGDPEWCAAMITEDGRPATLNDVREAGEALGPIIGNTVHATFGFPNGIPAFFASMKNGRKEASKWGLDILGTEGMAVVRMDSKPLVAYSTEPGWAMADDKNQWQRLPNRPEIQPRTPEQVAHYAPIVDDLIAAIKEDRQPAVSIEDGLAATEMIQAVFDSHLRGCRVALPLEKRTHPLRG